MRVTVIGANGFVGSAFCRLFRSDPGVDLIAITRDNYGAHKGLKSDLVIEAACNSRKFLADQNPLAEFEASVNHRLRTLLDFPATRHLHISSVDVYSDLTSPQTTREDSPVEISRSSHYGFHKWLAEQLTRHYAENWLILRLAGMVGPNLKKNPVYDILNRQPLRIHPDSRYQFISTDDVARITSNIVKANLSGQIFNICGDGLISPREIAQIAERELDLSLLSSDSTPRVVDASIEKARSIAAIPSTRDSVRNFIAASPPL